MLLASSMRGVCCKISVRHAALLICQIKFPSPVEPRQMAFLYRRVHDKMLMVHNPDTKIYGTPDHAYYEFDDKNIQEYIMQDMPEDEFKKLSALFKFNLCTKFPKHLGNFVRDYVELNNTRELVESICREDYTVADEMIQKALMDYTSLPLEQRISLHRKEINKIKAQLRHEQNIWLS